MAKFIWFLVVVGLILVVHADDEKIDDGKKVMPKASVDNNPDGVVSLEIQRKRFPPTAKGPLLISSKVELIDSKSNEPALPMVHLIKSEPIEPVSVDNNDENSKKDDDTNSDAAAALGDESDSQMLKPIEPIFPSFLRPDGIFSKLPFWKHYQPGQMLASKLVNANQEDDEENQPPKRGILTIILVKSHKNDGDVKAKISTLESSHDLTEFKDNILSKAEEKFKSLKNFLMNDLFGKKQNEQNDENTIVRQHLLGGPSDPDHFFGFRQNPSFENEEKDSSEEDKERIESFLRAAHENFENSPMISDDIGFMPHPSEVNHKKHGCNFMRFMHLKASVYYNTIVHLLFISGVILIILLMTILTIRIHRRRNALRYYSKNNMNVSSIDSALAKKKEAEANDSTGSGKRLFRLGNLRTSYEQRYAPSVLLNAPPAYDQLSQATSNENVSIKSNGKAKSSLIKSLADAYKNRYQRLTTGTSSQQGEHEERQSISSLPAYDENMVKSSNQNI